MQLNVIKPQEGILLQERRSVVKGIILSQVWLYTSVIPVFRRLRQKDGEFQARAMQ
jgi:hypothetical protein